MTKNVGLADSIVRIILAGVIIALGIIYQKWWGFLGLIPLITGIISYCPTYSLLGVHTCKDKIKQ